MISHTAFLEVTGDANRYVSRGAFKLIRALDEFNFDAKGRIALDIGVSTGGFTQVLLERGAAQIWCVDVGRGQLSTDLKDDPRVRVLERTDARNITPDLIPEAVTAIVADVSFISLLKALPRALKLAAPGCWLVALIKPQFEVGQKLLVKGVVKDDAVRQSAIDKILEFIPELPDAEVSGVTESPIHGPKGNVEYLLGLTRET